MNKNGLVLLAFLGGFVGMVVLLLIYIIATVNDAVTAIALIGVEAGTDPTFAQDVAARNSSTSTTAFPWNLILKAESNAVISESETILTDYFDNARDAAGNKIGPLMGETQILEGEWSDLKSLYSSYESGSSSS